LTLSLVIGGAMLVTGAGCASYALLRRRAR
jgi:hypothetical protein